MGEVIHLTEIKKQDDQQYIAGEAICLGCKHVWAQVAAKGIDDFFECPSCGTHKGVYKYPFMPPKQFAVFQCNCGNMLFYMTHEGCFCPGCGEFMTF